MVRHPDARSILNRFNEEVSHYFRQNTSLHGKLRRRNASLLYSVEQEQPGKSVRATLVVVSWLNQGDDLLTG